MKKSYQELENKGIYEIFDYAEFLKNNEKFEESIEYYTEVLKNIDSEHPLYPEVTDGKEYHMKELESGIRQKKIYYHP